MAAGPASRRLENRSALVTTMTCNRLLRFSTGGELLETTKFDTYLWAVAVSDSGGLLPCTVDHYVEDDCLAERSSKIQLWRRDDCGVVRSGSP
jgi:hypothetical protein